MFGNYRNFASEHNKSEKKTRFFSHTVYSRFAKITAPFVGTSSDDGDDYIAIRKLEDQLMGVRIKEAGNMAELKEMRQKSKFVLSISSQLSAIVQENVFLRERLEAFEDLEKENEALRERIRLYEDLRKK
ncbi:unnamed protein product [Haemonchus placei]|uniref:Protein CASP n=1 Tax=Haemonchus placei TaxID=6290 RepID=A0A0N4WZ09_HAEPC|nr:unnamed protein product [Haemonchus placei]